MDRNQSPSSWPFGSPLGSARFVETPQNRTHSIDIAGNCWLKDLEICMSHGIVLLCVPAFNPSNVAKWVRTGGACGNSSDRPSGEVKPSRTSAKFDANGLGKNSVGKSVAGTYHFVILRTCDSAALPLARWLPDAMKGRRLVCTK